MIVPKLHFVDANEKRDGFYRVGDVIAQTLEDEVPPNLYVVETSTVGSSKAQFESAFRVGVQYPTPKMQYEKYFVHRRISAAGEGREFGEFKLAKIRISETERFVDACAAYENVKSELLDLDCAISLVVRPDDESVKRYLGFFDSSWHSVEFLFTPVGNVEFTVNFFENDSTGEMVSSDYGWKKNFINKSIKDDAEERLRFVCWNVFQPKLCVLIGVRTVGEPGVDDFLDVDNYLHDNGLQNSYKIHIKERLQTLQNYSSIVSNYDAETTHVFSVYGHVSYVEEFLLDLAAYYEESLLFVHRFERDKYLCDPYHKGISLSRDVTMCKKRREFMIGLIVVLKSCELPPYLILEILDWNTCIQTMDHKEKIDLIYAIQKSINSIVEKRESNKKIKM